MVAPSRASCRPPGPESLRARFADVARSVEDDDLLFSTGADWEFD